MCCLLDIYILLEVPNVAQKNNSIWPILIPLLIAALAFAGHVIKGIMEFRQKKEEIKEGRIIDKRKEIGRKLNEFYGPFLQNAKKSTTLYRALTKNKNDFRLLDYLLDPSLFSPLSGNDKILVQEIIDIGTKQRKLIEEKGGLIDDRVLCSFNSNLKVNDQFPFERRDLHNIGLIPRVNAHYRILELAHNGKISGEITKFEDYRFPRELPQEIERRFNELQHEMKILRSSSSESKIDYKKYLNRTIKSYDETAEDYAINVANLSNSYIVEFIDKVNQNFAELQNSDISILDVGCGSGRDLEIFKSKNFNIKGIDKSKKLLKIASKKIDNKYLQHCDILNLKDLKGKYHGIWINASLLHIPKSNLPNVLSSFVRKMHTNGIIYISVKEGYGETFEHDNRYSGVEKFWSYFTEYELKNLMENVGITIVSAKVEKPSSSYASHPWINIIGKL